MIAGVFSTKNKRKTAELHLTSIKTQLIDKMLDAYINSHARTLIHFHCQANSVELQNDGENYIFKIELKNQVLDGFCL